MIIISKVSISRNGVQTFLTREISVALISVTIVNLLVSPLTIFLNILFILAVKTSPLLRNKYNALLACLAGTEIMTDTLGHPLFIAKLIYRLIGSPASELCTIPYAARRSMRSSFMSALQYLAVTFTFKYRDIVTKHGLIVSVVLVWSLVFLIIIFFSI